MVKFFLNKIAKSFQALVLTDLETNKMLSGKILSNSNKTLLTTNLHDVEFKVFSQWGDDGIIQYLTQHIDLPNKTFIEFGVENYTEANTRFLLKNNNWSGLILDGSKENMDFVRKSNLSWQYDLQIKDIFVTAENINELITETGFEQELGLLHIDIDGNDYWIWDKIDVINPIIVIVEYNSVFGSDKSWTIPYDSTFYRSRSHYSNLYYGSSLTSLCDLAEKKGYYFIGCNSNGNNSYFIRKDKIGHFKPLTVKEGFVKSKFQESRDESGKLNYLKGDKRLAYLKGLEIYNTRKNITETI